MSFEWEERRKSGETIFLVSLSGADAAALAHALETVIAPSASGGEVRAPNGKTRACHEATLRLPLGQG